MDETYDLQLEGARVGGDVLPAQLFEAKPVCVATWSEGAMPQTIITLGVHAACDAQGLRKRSLFRMAKPFANSSRPCTQAMSGRR